MSAGLNEDQLNALLADVDNMDEEKLKEMAKKVIEDREKRKKYHSGANLTPEQKAERKTKQSLRNKTKREREKAILKRAAEMGLISKEAAEGKGAEA